SLIRSMSPNDQIIEIERAKYGTVLRDVFQISGIFIWTPIYKEDSDG
ncbi:7672_t:CDS:1, partial [Cetraspora pellucida]